MPDDALYAQVMLTPDLPVPPPTGAHFFHLTTLEGEYQLLIGYVNLHSVLKSGEGGPPVVPMITHRLMLTQFGFDQLTLRVDELRKKLAANRAAFEAEKAAAEGKTE